MLLFGNFFETNKDQISYETYNNKCNSCTIAHITTYSDLLWVEIAWESHNKKDRLHKNCWRTARYHSRKLYQYMSEGKKDQDLYIVNGWTPVTPFSSCLFEVSLVIFGQVLQSDFMASPVNADLLFLWTAGRVIWSNWSLSICHIDSAMDYVNLMPFLCHSDGILMGVWWWLRMHDVDRIALWSNPSRWIQLAAHLNCYPVNQTFLCHIVLWNCLPMDSLLLTNCICFNAEWKKSDKHWCKLKKKEKRKYWKKDCITEQYW